MIPVKVRLIVGRKEVDIIPNTFLRRAMMPSFFLHWVSLYQVSLVMLSHNQNRPAVVFDLSFEEKSPLLLVISTKRMQALEVLKQSPL